MQGDPNSKINALNKQHRSAVRRLKEEFAVEKIRCCSRRVITLNMSLSNIVNE